jgi:hypothetical protein
MSDSDQPIDLSEDPANTPLVRKIHSLNALIASDLAAEIKSATTLLEENGYPVTPPTRHPHP